MFTTANTLSFQDGEYRIDAEIVFNEVALGYQYIAHLIHATNLSFLAEKFGSSEIYVSRELAEEALRAHAKQIKAKYDTKK